MVHRDISTSRMQLLLVVLLLLHSRSAFCQTFPVTIDRVSGCMDVGMSTDKLYGRLRYHHLRQRLRPLRELSEQWCHPIPAYLRAGYLPAADSLERIHFTSSTITARLSYPFPTTASSYHFYNMSIGSGPYNNVTTVSAPLVAALRYARQQPPSIGSATCPTSGDMESPFCDFYSTVSMYGYYLDAVTQLTVSAFIQNSSGTTFDLFSVSCTNLSLSVLSVYEWSGTLYTLTCQLPLLSLPAVPLSYFRPRLLLTLVSPYGVRTDADARYPGSHLRLNRTYWYTANQSVDTNSAHHTTQATASAVGAAMLLLVLLAV